MKIYLVGSLREGRVRDIACALREAGHDVFDDWHACHPDADESWRVYEQQRGRGYREAMDGKFVRNCFNFDLENLHNADAVVLVSKPGKLGGWSAACELTWARCNSKRTFVLLDGEPERWEMMALLCVEPADIVSTVAELLERL